jgi:hypothetical protein
MVSRGGGGKLDDRSAAKTDAVVTMGKAVLIQ